MHLDVDLTAAVTTFLVGFLVSAVSGRYLIPFLRRLKAGQTERSDGPQSHLKKTGTPNMGGLMILLGVTLACFLPFRGQRNTIPVLILTIGFGLIGFADDYIKVVKKRSDGLLAWQKFLLQVLVSLLFAFYVQKIQKLGNSCYFVALLIGLNLSQEKIILATPSTYDMDFGGIISVVLSSSDSFSVYGYNVTLAPSGYLLRPKNKIFLELLGVYEPEHPSESMYGGNTIRQFQILFEPLLSFFCKQYNNFPIISPCNECSYCNKKNIN